MNTRQALLSRSTAWLATSLLCVLIAFIVCGCHSPFRKVKHHTRLGPLHHATTPPHRPPVYLQHPFFGFYPTCWRAWPEGWVPCPPPCWVETEVEEIPAGSAQRKGLEEESGGTEDGSDGEQNASEQELDLSPLPLPPDEPAADPGATEPSSDDGAARTIPSYYMTRQPYCGRDLKAPVDEVRIERELRR